MSNFKHILITRFNLRSSKLDWTRDHSSTKDEWMEHRWEIFIRYCLPSILNQSNKNFIWFIYFDQKTTEIFKKKIEQLYQLHSLIHPIYVNSYEEFVAKLPTDILQTKDDQTTHFISSRIDNDDCFHRDAIEKIQRQFSEQDYQLINLAKGFCLQTVPSFSATTYTYYSGPFISLIEKISPNQKLKTIMEKDHHDYFHQNNITQLESDTYWVQVIHKYNVSNTFRGKPVQIDFKNEYFGFELRQDQSYHLYIKLMSYLLLHFPILFLKNNLKKLLGKSVTYK